MGMVPPRIVPPRREEEPVGYQPLPPPQKKRRRDGAEQLKEEHPSTSHPEMAPADPTLDPPQGGSCVSRSGSFVFDSHIVERDLLHRPLNPDLDIIRRH